jgi:phospholipase B-like protein
MVIRRFCFVVALLSVFAAPLLPAVPAKADTPSDPRLKNAYRFQQGGWTYVHLEGSPAQIGFQHGYLLAPEIQDAFQAIQLNIVHNTKREWDFYQKTAREMLWPHIDAEYQQELQGITDGLKAQGVNLSLDDIVAFNAFEEVPDYYVPWLNKREKIANAPRLVAPGNCSAFIATGSMTKDHKIVIAHNNWTSYLAGERWVIMLDIVPEHGNRMLMDGFPGVITSDDDFGINSAGIMSSETTITQFEGWDPNGKPEFVRSRKALQYADSIDDYVRIIKDGNNGGYANDWLIGDRKTGEIAYLELGLKNTPLWRSKDGYFVSSNFAQDPKVLTEETTFDSKDMTSSPNARRVRWEQLMKENKGKIDVDMAEGFLGDHFDSYEKKQQADERSLCGHVDTVAKGIPQWEWGGYDPAGAVQGKATDSNMAAKMSLRAHAGHPCGQDFIAKDFLDQHPEYDWERSVLRDMKAGPWTTFTAGQKAQP